MESKTLINTKHYYKIKFSILKTQHLLIKGKLNHIKASFILDTGASNSCLGFNCIDKFNLQAEYSATKAAGAGATNMETQIANNSLLQLSYFKNSEMSWVLLDLSHVNFALASFKTKAVDGIIGADILIKHQAIIDYNSNYLYLKKPLKN